MRWWLIKMLLTVSINQQITTNWKKLPSITFTTSLVCVPLLYWKWNIDLEQRIVSIHTVRRHTCVKQVTVTLTRSNTFVPIHSWYTWAETGGPRVVFRRRQSHVDCCERHFAQGQSCLGMYRLSMGLFIFHCPFLSRQLCSPLTQLPPFDYFLYIMFLSAV